MDFVDLARAIFALVLTLGLIGLGAVGLRRYGPDALARFVPARKIRRLSVVETLVLDPARRIVIFECDGQERMLLLGEGQMIAGPTPALPKPDVPAAPTAAAAAKRKKSILDLG